MSGETNEPSVREQRVNEVIAAYLNAVDAGEAPDPKEFIAAHSDIAAELESFFTNRDEFERMAEPLQPAGAATPELRAIDATLASDGEPVEAPTLASTGTDRPAIGTLVRYFGDYELLEEIARGGMGVVYKARQVSLNRIVALKMILAGQLASEGDVKRFHVEAEAAANLDHPGIVPIHEVGVHDGQHYFSMGFIEGSALSARVADRPMPPKEAAVYTRKIAQAVAYAHEHGVIHRDLKPANVLLDENDEPKVTDFGLAKKVEGDSGLTATGQILGTPGYMPPEQASGKIDEVTETADIYSLGALLYSLLTARPPFQADNPLDTLMQVLEQEPVSPRQLNSKLPRDLETICLKCLEKERRRRYASAHELAEDLQRFLDGEAIKARPVGTVERTVKWVKRKPVITALIGAVALSLLLGIAVSTFFAVNEFQQRQLAERREQEATEAKTAAERARANERRERERAQRGEKEAQWNLYVQRMYPIMYAWEKRDFGRLEELLAASVPKHGEPDLRGWEWFYFHDQCRQASRKLVGPESYNGEAAWCRRSGRVAAARQDRAIDIWDPTLQRIECTLPREKCSIIELAWSPDGKRLACAYQKLATIWDVAEQKVIHRFEDENERNLRSVSWSSDGELVAVGGMNGVIRVFNSQDGSQVGNLKPNQPSDLRQYVFDLDWHPDGGRLAVATRGGMCCVLDVETGRELFSRKSNDVGGNPLRSVAWSPDGTKLASGGMPNIIVRDKRFGEFAHARLSSQVTVVEWSPAGERLLSGSSDHTVKVWDATLKELRSLRIHHSPIVSVAWGPQGQRILTGTTESIRISDVGSVTSPALMVQLKGKNQGGEIRDLTWCPDGRRLAFCQAPNGIFVCDPTERIIEQTLTTTRAIESICWLDATRLVSLQYDGRATVWDTQSGTIVRRMNAPFIETGGNVCVRARPDGKTLAIANHQVSGEGDGATTLYDTANWRRIAKFGNLHRCIDWSPDGRFLAAGGATNPRHIELWDLVTARRVYNKSCAPVRGEVHFSPCGRLIAAATEKGTVYFIRALDGQVVAKAQGHKGPVASVKWSPNGRRVASSGEDGAIRIWDGATGMSLVTFPAGGPVKRVAWSPDGRRLAAARMDGVLMIWGSPATETTPEDASHLETGVLASVPSYEEQLKDLAKRQTTSGSSEADASIVDVSQAQSFEELLSAAKQATDWRRPAEAEPAYQDAAFLLEQLLANNPQHPDRMKWKTNLSGAYDWLGAHLRNEKRFDQAKDAYLKLIALRERLLDEHAHDVRYRIELDESLIDLTSVLGETGEYEQAFVMLGRAIEQRRSTLSNLKSASGQADTVQRDALQEKIRQVETAMYALQLQSARIHSVAGDRDAMQTTLDACRPHDGQEDRRGWEWYYLNSLCHREDAELETAYRTRRHDKSVPSMSWNPDGDRIAVAWIRDVVQVWEPDSGSILASTPDHSRGIWCVAWSPGGDRLATASIEGIVKIYKADASLIRALPGKQAEIQYLAWRADGKQIASSDYDGVVIIRNAETGEQKLTFETAPGSVISWSTDGRRIAATTPQGSIGVWDTDSGELTAEIGTAIDGLVHHPVAWSPDGVLLAWGSDDGKVGVWNPATGASVFQVRGHGSGVRSVAWSPDSRRLATGDKYGWIRICDAETGGEVLAFKSHDAYVRALAWNSDGRKLASASLDRTVKVWDATWGFDPDAPVVPEPMQEEPAANTLATGQENSTLELWVAEPKSADKMDPGGEAKSIPQLLEPTPGAILGNREALWEFKWSEVADATEYELYVIGRSARIPAVNITTEGTSYLEERNGYVVDRLRKGWSWKVRAIVDGQPMDWSVPRTFDVKPLGYQ